MTAIDKLKEVIHLETARQSEIWSKCFDDKTIMPIKDWGESLRKISDAINTLEGETLNGSKAVPSPFTEKGWKRHPPTGGRRMSHLKPPREPLLEYLETLRFEGWMVAVHNDYRVKSDIYPPGKIPHDIRGEFFTFWLFTHPNGTFVKGEGKTDTEAVKQAYDQAAPPGGR